MLEDVCRVLVCDVFRLMAAAGQVIFYVDPYRSHAVVRYPGDGQAAIGS